MRRLRLDEWIAKTAKGLFVLVVLACLVAIILWLASCATLRGLPDGYVEKTYCYDHNGRGLGDRCHTVYCYRDFATAEQAKGWWLVDYVGSDMTCLKNSYEPDKFNAGGYH